MVFVRAQEDVYPESDGCSLCGNPMDRKEQRFIFEIEGDKNHIFLCNNCLLDLKMVLDLVPFRTV